jgi:hypothetical protein
LPPWGGRLRREVSLWLPELFGTEARATAFAVCTSVDRYIGAGVNFGSPLPSPPWAHLARLSLSPRSHSASGF